jgi:hypothetical protein
MAVSLSNVKYDVTTVMNQDYADIIQQVSRFGDGYLSRFLEAACGVDENA